MKLTTRGFLFAAAVALLIPTGLSAKAVLDFPLTPGGAYVFHTAETEEQVVVVRHTSNPNWVIVTMPEYDPTAEVMINLQQITAILVSDGQDGKSAASRSIDQAIAENLSKLDGAKQQWALENNAATTSEPEWFQLIGNQLYIRSMPIDPEGGVFILRDVASDPALLREGGLLILEANWDGPSPLLERRLNVPIVTIGGDDAAITAQLLALRSVVSNWSRQANNRRNATPDWEALIGGGLLGAFPIDAGGGVYEVRSPEKSPRLHRAKEAIIYELDASGKLVKRPFLSAKPLP
jgi:hypothetical protein